MNPEFKVYPSGDTLTILQGDALEQKHPVKIVLKGNIDSVSQFLSKRYNGRDGHDLQKVEKDKAVVLIDKESMTVKLLLDPQNVFGTEVTGVLEFTKELTQFQINSTKQFTREELIKLFRFNRRFISSDFEKLLLSYQKLSLSTNGNIGVDTDNRGNKSVNFQKVVDSQNIPTDFILTVPVFKGFDSKTFRVEICLDATDASVRFWFESTELHEIIEKEKEDIINAELEHCKDFVTIYS